MDDTTLQRLFEELNGAAAEGMPQSHIESGRPDAYLWVRANRAGLLSLAATFLKAALSSPQESHRDPARLSEAHDQIWKTKRDFVIGLVEHAEVVPLSEEELARRNRPTWMGQFGCVVAGFAFLFLTMSGVIFWIAVFTDGLK